MEAYLEPDGTFKMKLFCENEPEQFGSPAERTGFRNSRSQLFFKIGGLKNFANSTGKHLYWSIFLISCRPEDLQLH